MAKVNKIKKTNKTSSTIRKKPKGVLAHAIHRAEIVSSPTIKKAKQYINKLINFHNKSRVTIKNGLENSRPVDIQRAKSLRAVAPRKFSKGVFTIMVQASGENIENEFGIPGYKKAKFHQIHLGFDFTHWTKEEFSKKTNKELFLETPIHYECACGRHTYWYRYIWTRLNASLGKQETRFPIVRNKMLWGMFCKHGIRAMLILQQSQFQKVFARYVENYKVGKQIRITNKDKGSTTFQSYLWE